MSLDGCFGSLCECYLPAVLGDDLLGVEFENSKSLF
jgi:hypothetical protein